MQHDHVQGETFSTATEELLSNAFLSLLTPRLYDWSVSSEHRGFLFLVFFISLFCCGSVRQIKLAIC